jgi:DNA-binding response OmpR family regulator
MTYYFGVTWRLSPFGGLMSRDGFSTGNCKQVKPMPILVVEDDAICREAIAEALRQESYEVQTAGNGLEAMHILARGKCDLVITDWMMPEINGLILCRAIRDRKFGSRPYVIVISSLNDPRDVSLAISSGANDFLAKPWRRSELLARVQLGELALQGGSQAPAVQEAACSG